GRVEVTREGYGFIIPLPKGEDRDCIVEKKFLKNVRSGDIVLAKIIAKKKKRPKGKIITCLEARNQKMIGYLEKYQLNSMVISIPDETPCKIKASQKSLKTLPQGTILEFHPDNGEILRILGTLEDPNIDEIITLELYNRQEVFTLQAEIQAKSAKKVCVKDFKERADLTYLPFCTIDPKTAKDHDDAIFYDKESSILYISIADVSYYVTPNSPLDIEAKNRSFSIYFPHKCIPMLPHSLSEDICSLKEGKVRLAMTFKIRLHRRTKAVLNTELFQSLIKVRQKLNYEEVDLFLQTGQSSTIKKSLHEMLVDLKVLTQALRKKRLQKGFDFLGENLELELDKNMELKSSCLQTSTISHQLIEECMLLANIQSAKMLEQKNLQNDLSLGIYRVHPKPKPYDIQSLFVEFRMLGLWRKNTIPATEESFHKAILEIQRLAKRAKIRSEVDGLIVRSMQQAGYLSQNIGHFGLGFEAVSDTHLTRPTILR
ncbi:MAG: RNB domain-containing ribonuclease, partial [Helicobacter sp.]|nr:RNB domain-containing ribonuclease [Helicobacter sp.]